MMGVGASVKDPLPTDKTVGEQPKTPERVTEKQQSLEPRGGTQGGEGDKIVSTNPGENQTKGRTGTPKKSERNMFAGPRQSPKKNPWTRNAPGEGGKEGPKEGGAGGSVASAGPEVTGAEGKGIEIPKGEVGQCVCYLWLICGCILAGPLCTVCTYISTHTHDPGFDYSYVPETTLWLVITLHLSEMYCRNGCTKVHTF